MSYRAVILDVDGTLVDSNDLHARAWLEVLGEAGHRPRLEDVRRLIGMGGDKLVAAVTGWPEDDPRTSAIGDRRSEVFRTRYLPEVRAFPGARALVERARDLGYRVAVGSSAREEELGPLLEIAGVTDLVETATSSDDAERSKPDPDIVVAAVRRLGLPAGACVMVGDTPYDLEAAQRAGVDLIAVRCGGWRDEDLRGAIAIYDGPADLLGWFDGKRAS